MGQALHGDGTVQHADLALVRGYLEADGVAVRHDDVFGTLSLDVDRFHCDLAPLGLAIAQSGCRDLVIEGVKLELSTLAVFTWQKPKRAPVTVDHVMLHDATLKFDGGALAPGLDAIQIHIDRAEAGPTTFKSPLSFLFAMTALGATIELPGGIGIRLDVEDGVLYARGTFLGKAPIELRLALPLRDASWDARAELRALVAYGQTIATRLLEQRVRNFVHELL